MRAARERTRARVLRAAAVLVGLCALLAPAARAQVWAAGWGEDEIFRGLTLPTAVRFAPDGRIFVAEKAGRVKVYDSLQDPTPDLLLDLGAAVHGYWDRGLLGLAVDPQFPARPFVYLLYTHNRIANDPTAPDPRWPANGCPNPPAGTGDGCTVDGRVSRIEVSPQNGLVGGELVLVEGRWCQQYPSHSVGDLAFDAAGMLIVTAGDGASFNFADYGQGGGAPGSPTPENVCGDPPVPVGGDQAPPAAEGGALRAQDARTPADPQSYDGAVLRIDPDTGTAAPGNPLLGGDPEDDRLIAWGLRNPFRVTRRPGTDEIWIGDVGWSGWEEIDRIADTEDGVVENFGWPCYEGPARQALFDGQDLSLCEDLYAEGPAAVAEPFWAYRHVEYIDPDPASRCSKVVSSALTGLAFYDDVTYPATYHGGLFFVDVARSCMWAMLAGPDGLPDPSTVTTIADGIASPVDLQLGPDGRLYFLDHQGGRVIAVEHFTGNTPPHAIVEATPDSGPVPLFLTVDATASYDDDEGDLLSFDWDVDGDGQFDDASGAFQSGPLPEPGVYDLAVRVTDLEGASDVASVQVIAGNTRPVAQILSPGPGFEWAVGDTVTLLGAGTDADDGAIDPATMEWEVVLHHCPGLECHTHPVTSVSGVDQLTIDAPDHEWFSYLGVTLRVSDSGIRGTGEGVLTGSVVRDLQPRTVDATFATDPPGLDLVLGGQARTAPFAQTLIVGSLNSVAAPLVQMVGDETYEFRFWSDGGPPAHQLVAADGMPALTATYSLPGACVSIDPTCDGVDDDCDGVPDDDVVAPTVLAEVACSADQLVWEPVFFVTGHDVVRGDLAALRASGGDFAAAVESCLAPSAPGTAVDLGSDPAPGAAWWYLARARNCAGTASWDTAGAGQAAPRDAALAASPASCP